MQASYISTQTLRNAARGELNTLQTELSGRVREIATGRHADVGLALAETAGRPVDARIDLGLLDTLITSNTTAAGRLELTQTALLDVRETASETLGGLISLPAGPTATATLERQALASLERLADRMNASDGKDFLFGGLNSDVKPFNRFDEGPQAAVEAAFLARFGVAVNDPGAAAIGAADMADFLDNEFAALFDDPAWGTWSSASSDDIVSRIAPSERVVTSANANADGIRSLAAGYAMVGGLGLGALQEDVRQLVYERARVSLGEGINETVALESTLGFSQEAIAKANERMTIGRDILRDRIAAAEGVDPAETKVRIDLITTQIEMSYALTGQIARLSILNYA